MGSIALTNAQIGRQQTHDGGQNENNSHDPNSYRHAFLILEPKKGTTIVDAKKNNSNVTRHVLCAETDEERDEWVEALIRYVGRDGSSGNNSRENSNDGNDESRINPERDAGRPSAGRKMPEIQKLGATPIKDLASIKGNEKLLLNQEAYERQQQPNSAQQGQQQQEQQQQRPPQQYQQGTPQGRPLQMPQSPTGHQSMDNAMERTSAENQYNSRYGQRPPNGGDAQINAPWNQQYQQPYPQQQQGQPPFSRNQSSNSLSQDDVSFSCPDPCLYFSSFFVLVQCYLTPSFFLQCSCIEHSLL